jgi:hypothetical protein
MNDPTVVRRGVGHTGWIAVLALVVGCVTGAAGTRGEPAAERGRVAGGRHARADIERALEAELATLAEMDRRIGELEAAVSRAEAEAREVDALRADRVARAGFAADLGSCLEGAATCPPVLDEPTPPATWDPASDELTGAFTPPADWAADAARLERAACGCRTADCVAWVLVELARWEKAAPPPTASDKVAVGHVTGARGCLQRRFSR